MSKKLEWAELWAAMERNYLNGGSEWVPTTEHMYDEMLGALPPVIQSKNKFLVGEPWNHNRAGDAVYAAFLARPVRVEREFHVVDGQEVLKPVEMEHMAQYMTEAKFKNQFGIR